MQLHLRVIRNNGFVLQVNEGKNLPGRKDKYDNSIREMLSKVEKSSSRIPQLDGPIPDPYDDILSTPNVISSLSPPLFPFLFFNISFSLILVFYVCLLF